VREADQYLAAIGTRYATAPSEETAKDLQQELALWEGVATNDYLAGDLSAVDLTVYPLIALFVRLASRRPDFVKDDFVGPRLSVWMDRMQALPIVQHTRPPHWK
jgi:glutathione S-transferase